MPPILIFVPIYADTELAQQISHAGAIGNGDDLVILTVLEKDWRRDELGIP